MKNTEKNGALTNLENAQKLLEFTRKQGMNENEVIAALKHALLATVHPDNIKRLFGMD